MRRWTDGKSWSASRVSGSFLKYREMEGRRGDGNVSEGSVSRAGKTSESTRDSDEHRGRDGWEPDGYRYKPDGLVKQSFSITTSTGQHLHLISYYSRSHPSAANLQQPTFDPILRHVRPQKSLYPESTADDQQSLPVATHGSMAGAPACPITPHRMPSYAPFSPTAPLYACPPTLLTIPPTVAVPPYGAHSYLSPSLQLYMWLLSSPPGPHIITSNFKPLLIPRFSCSDSFSASISHVISAATPRTESTSSWSACGRPVRLPRSLTPLCI